MYYEEKLINGVLMCRRSPHGDWSQCSIERMSERIIELTRQIKYLTDKLDNI